MPQEQTPTASDAEKRHDILQAIDEIVQTGLPEHPGLCIKPYGSYVSGLYCPSGDLDLSIEGVPTAGWVSLPGTQKIYPEENTKSAFCKTSRLYLCTSKRFLARCRRNPQSLMALEVLVLAVLCRGQESHMQCLSLLHSFCILHTMDACRSAAGMPVKSIGKGGKADLLRTVSKKLEKRRLHRGWIERILHARVPILKFNIQGMLSAS